jgi:hypothetical protein
MKKILCLTVLSLLFAGVFGSAALARSVYFKDGSVIENAKSAWQSKGKVHILVNRDTYLTFPAAEIDINKSFGRHRSGRISSTARQRKLHAPPQAGNNFAASAGAAGKDAAAVSKVPAPAAKAVAMSASEAAAKSAAAGNGSKAAASAPLDRGAKPAKPAASAGLEAEGAKKDEAAAGSEVRKPLPPAANQAGQTKPKLADLFWVMLKTPSGQIFLLMFFVCLVSFWKVYEKAGQAGWKSLIPIYNVIVLLQMAGKPIWWIVLFLIPLLNVVFVLLMYMELAKRFSKHPAFAVGMTFLPAVFFGILAFDKSSYGTTTGGDGFTFE